MISQLTTQFSSFHFIVIRYCSTLKKMPGKNSKKRKSCVQTQSEKVVPKPRGRPKKTQAVVPTVTA